MRFSVDRTWRRPHDGDVVLAGSPTTAFRLTDAGRRVIDAIEKGDDVPVGAAGLIDRLVDAGAIHPLADPARMAINPADITVVIPFHSRDASAGPALVGLVASLGGLARVIVVDDASPIHPPTLEAPPTPVELIRRDANGGPGAARNTGLALVTTPYVAFVDSDVECVADDIVALAGWLASSSTHLIAPRIITPNDGSTLGSYEASRSPLDMGERPGRVRAGTRIAYVPAAVLLCEVAVLREVGGFDESLRTGEDVDLVWRIDAAGYRCRYEPAIVVGHRRRSRLVAMLEQRVGYGESTPALHARHGDKVAPVKGSWSSIGAWITLFTGIPLVAAALATTHAALLVRKLKFLPNSAVEATRLAVLTHLQVGKNLAAAITRVWWPVALLAAFFSRRVRVAVCAAALVPALAEWWEKRPQLDPIRFATIRTIDDAAYGTGAWKSALRERNIGALLPNITRHDTRND